MDITKRQLAVKSYHIITKEQFIKYINNDKM